MPVSPSTHCVWYLMIADSPHSATRGMTSITRSKPNDNSVYAGRDRIVKPLPDGRLASMASRASCISLQNLLQRQWR